jgi:hypothetical protein
MKRCPFADDHGPTSLELEVHARGCPDCARSLALRSLARETWDAAHRRDAATRRSARERMLMTAPLRMAARQARAPHRLAMAVALVATVTVMSLVARAAALWASRRAAVELPEGRSVEGSTVARAAPTAPFLPPSSDAAAAQETAVENDAEARLVVRHETAPVTRGSAPTRSADPAVDPGLLWERSEAEIARGDRLDAERTLRGLLALHPGALLRSRAELRLGELLLARGARDEARSRLEPIALGSDVNLSSEAVWLFVRCFSSPGERAVAWGEVLGASPSPTMRTVAQVEQATELANAGDMDRARALLAALPRESIPPVAADAYQRLEARFGRDAGYAPAW